MAKHKVQVNTITCTAAMCACEACGEWRQALQLLSATADHSIEVNTLNCNAAVNACDHGGEWRQAMQLMRLTVDQLD